MIVCGWCHSETVPGRCSTCGRDPALPWVQRAEPVPEVNEGDRFRRRIAEAAKAIEAEGLRPTAERIAEHLDITARTVRRWRADVRPTT